MPKKKKEFVVSNRTPIEVAYDLTLQRQEIEQTQRRNVEKVRELQEQNRRIGQQRSEIQKAIDAILLKQGE